MTGLYIHIPFCASKCIYCNFYSTLTKNTFKTRKGEILTQRQRYINAVCKEISKQKAYLSTIYLGGGTPSQLSSNELTQIFEQIHNTFLQDSKVSLPKEITIECNPEDITEEFVQTLKELSINRVSMGVQTFSDERLKFLHRRHNSRKIPEAINLLRKADFNNISIDLMFGFPKQTQEEWITDIKKAIELNVEHISAYSLMYEEKTSLYTMLKHKKVTRISEEEYRDMYEELIDRLEKAGYEQYEISNFAKPSFRSKHNSSYWHNIPYIGIGAAAHSYDIQTRRWNYSDIEKYIEAIEQDTPAYEEEIINADTHYNDSIVTALRTKDGLNPDDFEEKYKKYFLINADPYIKNGNISKIGNHYAITRKGLYISDTIMTDLIIV